MGKHSFNAATDIPDLAGKTVVVTGGKDDNLGRGACTMLIGQP